MKKYSNVAIVTSFFCLWIVSLISDKYQLILGFLLIFTFGILHGANDIVLITTLNKSKKNLSFFKILLYYIVIVSIGATCFYLFPLTALLMFIIVSGYHFGEQQWQIFDSYKNNNIIIAFKSVYGIFILFLLFNFHKIEVQNIVLQITSVLIPVFYILVVFKIFGTLLFCFLLYLYIYEKNYRLQILLECFYILVFSVIFMSASLIWGFAIFFIIWHSVPSIMDQIKFLYNEVNLENFKSYFKSAFLYWIASLFGIAVLYFIFKDEKIFNALFFSALASITFPHAFVIVNMYKKSI